MEVNLWEGVSDRADIWSGKANLSLMIYKVCTVVWDTVLLGKQWLVFDVSTDRSAYLFWDRCTLKTKVT